LFPQSELLNASLSTETTTSVKGDLNSAGEEEEGSQSESEEGEEGGDTEGKEVKRDPFYRARDESPDSKKVMY